MLEHVDSHERHGFADLEALCAFLHEQVKDGAQGPKTPGESACDL